MIDTALIDYAVLHRDDDVARLLLKGGNIDLPLVAQQIEGWRTARDKWPTLARCDKVWYPPRLNREQSSSEATARYKAALFVKPGETMADLTGGMGIDCLFATRAGATTDYVERDEKLCEAMRHNLAALSIDGCVAHCADSMDWIKQSAQIYDTIYIDPARRDSNGGRVWAFEDCTPNLIENLDLLMSHCRQLVVKASPMIDLATARKQIGQHLCKINIVAIKGECKEVLFVCTRENNGDILTSCINIDAPLRAESFVGRAFDYYDSEESAAMATYCTDVEQYLYEPHAALMKGGAYSLIGERYSLAKLSRNTHLYTSQQIVEDFPGRIFEIISPTPLSVKSIKKAIPDGRAHVVCRNYPIGASALQNQLHIKEGGDIFVFATTIGTKKSGLVCRKIQ